MPEPLLLGDGIELIVEAPLPQMVVTAELPPFITTEPVAAILVSGPQGDPGPPGPPGTGGSYDDLPDYSLIFENHLI